MHINDLLKLASDKGASDVHLKVGSHPVIRQNGKLMPMPEYKRLMQEDTIAMAFSIMSARQKQKFKDNYVRQWQQELDVQSARKARE